MNTNYNDNKCKKITCTSMERTNLRQFIIVIKIVITVSVVHFQNELNQKRSQYPSWFFNYKISEFSPTKLSVSSLLFTLASII